MPKSLTKKLDKIFSEIVRARGACQKCGKTTGLQCAHVISRVNHHTRWDLDNALALCLRCHIFWQHKNPHEFVRWYDEKYGNYDVLKQRAQSIEKIDQESILENLLRIKNDNS